MTPPTERRTYEHRDAEYLWRLRDYKTRVSELFPNIPHRMLEERSVFPVDALVLGYFLEGLGRELTVYEIGPFAGVSSYLFATHRAVSKLVSMEPNPDIADEAATNTEWAARYDLETLRDLRPFDVAREVLGSLDGRALEKVEFVEGVVGSGSPGARTEGSRPATRVGIPRIGPAGEELVAYVAGLYTKEGATEGLQAVFERNPRATAVVDDCRHARGAFVQAGVVEFLEQSGSDDGAYSFRLLADLGPGVATSNLGIVHHEADTGAVDAAMRHVGSRFTNRLDPLELLIRESELVEEVNFYFNNVQNMQQKIERLDQDRNRLNQDKGRLEQDNHRLKQNNRRLKRDNAILTKALHGRSHQATELVKKSVMKIPGVSKLMREG